MCKSVRVVAEADPPYCSYVWFASHWCQVMQPAHLHLPTTAKMDEASTEKLYRAGKTHQF